MGGGVAFVGLVVQHLLRSCQGAAHRPLVIAAAVGGAAFLVWCDVLARLVPLTVGGMADRSELPLGVVTGLIGAPLFLWVLVRTRSEE